MIERKHILVAPLNWGLGHATRCIPIINLLGQNPKLKISVAAEGRALELLRLEFPDLNCIEFPDYGITFPSRGNVPLHFARLLPRIIGGILGEHKDLSLLIKREKVDAIISDNRYGLFSTKIPTAFITHQTRIKAPAAEQIVHYLNKKFISKFDRCWIPDVPGNPNLSGDLSHSYTPPNAQFIGELSRFAGNTPSEQKEIDVLCLISGAEPARSMFEKIMLNQLRNYNGKAVMVSGKTEIEHQSEDSGIKKYSHLPAKELEVLMNKSKIVIARSGYSTIMDLAATGNKAVLIPTPGQSEQEYLADYHKSAGHFYSVAQKKFNLHEALQKAEKYKGIKIEKSGLSEKIVEEFIQHIS